MISGAPNSVKDPSDFTSAISGRVRRILSPIVISQAANSLSGASVMLFGAFVLNPRQLSILGILTLVQSMSLGFVRAAIWQPAMMAGRKSGATGVPLRYALVAMAVPSALLLPVFSLEAGSLVSAACLVALNILALSQDWLRYGAIGVGRIRLLAFADGARLMVTLAGLGALQMLSTPRLATSYMAIYLLAFGAGLVPFFWAHLAGTPSLRFGEYRSVSIAQLSEWIISSATTQVPVLILGTLSTTPLIGAIRLVQTLYGPVNMAFSAASSDLLRFVSQGGSGDVDRAIIAGGRRLSQTMLVVTLPVVVGGSVFLWVSGVSIGAVSSHLLLVSFLLVGFLITMSGISGAHATVLRLLLRQRIIVRARAGILIASLVGYGAGWAFASPDLSLVLGFICTAIAYPLFLLRPAREVYREHSTEVASEGFDSMKEVTS